MELPNHPSAECPEPVPGAPAASTETSSDPPRLGSDWIALDVEYTGSSSAPHLLELGAVRVADGEIQDHFQSLVAPPVPIDPESARVHGLGDDDVRTAPFKDEVVPAFFAWIGASPLVAHGAGADARVLGFECARLGIEPPGNPLFDSLELAKRAWSAAPDHRLETLVEYLELEAGTLHRALSDATLCAEVVLSALGALEDEDATGESNDRSEEQALFRRAGTPQLIAQSVPLRPHRRPAQLRVLERARAAGATITMLYGAPPDSASLEVRPCLLYRAHKRGYLEAECVRSGSLKTFRLDRIQKLVVNEPRSV